MSDDERRSIAGRVRMQRQKMFGTKSDAYKAANLNSATWDRIEAGLPVREDRLIAALKALWPKSDGDWTAINSELDDDMYYLPLLGVGPDDPGYFLKLEAWVLELQRRVEGLEAYVKVDERTPPAPGGLDRVDDPADVAAEPVVELHFPGNDVGFAADMPPGPVPARRGQRTPHIPGHTMDPAGGDNQDRGQ